MSPADALDRVVYLLDRALAEGRRVQAYAKARDLVRELGDDADRRSTTPTAPCSTCRASARPPARSSPRRSTAGIDEYLAELEDETAIDVGEGAELRAALKGDCHSHTTWSDGGAPTEVMARTAQALGHEYLVVTDHSPRLTIAHGLNRERLLQQLDEIEALNEELAPRSASSPAWRSTSSRTARSTRTTTCSSGSTSSSPACTRSCACPSRR